MLAFSDLHISQIQVHQSATAAFIISELIGISLDIVEFKLFIVTQPAFHKITDQVNFPKDIEFARMCHAGFGYFCYC